MGNIFATVVGDTCAEAWEKSIGVLLEHEDVERYLSAEGPCWEISNLVMVVKHPLDDPRVSSAYDFRGELVDYTCDLTLNRQPGVESLYDRLYRWKAGRSKINQIAEMVKRLRAEPTSRRGIVAVWNPAIDLQNPHPMAFLTLAFRARSTGLDLTTVVRSNDAWFAAPADMKAFTDLQQMVARELSISVGTYVHHCISYHIYDYDVPRAVSLLGKKQRELFGANDR